MVEVFCDSLNIDPAHKNTSQSKHQLALFACFPAKLHGAHNFDVDIILKIYNCYSLTFGGLLCSYRLNLTLYLAPWRCYHIYIVYGIFLHINWFLYCFCHHWRWYYHSFFFFYGRFAHIDWFSHCIEWCYHFHIVLLLLAISTYAYVLVRRELKHFSKKIIIKPNDI